VKGGKSGEQYSVNFGSLLYRAMPDEEGICGKKCVDKEVHFFPQSPTTRTFPDVNYHQEINIQDEHWG